jgi:hypothetical protein
MPHPRAACDAVADYLAHPPRISTCIPPLGGRPSATATVAGTFDGHPFHLELIAASSWCGQPTAIMRDYWVLSDFPCVTEVVIAPGDSARNVCERVQAADRSAG